VFFLHARESLGLGAELRGKAKAEACSLRRRITGQVSGVLAGDPLGNGEAEAVAGFAGVESDEAFEDALTLVFGYAGSVVCNTSLDVSVEPP
jgi:hypothetical protein